MEQERELPVLKEYRYIPSLFSVLSHPGPQVIHELVGAKILQKRHFPLLWVKLWSREGGAKPHWLFPLCPPAIEPLTQAVMEVCSRAGN